MHLSRHLVFAGSLVALGCSFASAVPSSDRSRAAEERVEKRLQRELALEGLELGQPVFMRIFKEPAVLELWVQGEDVFKLFRTYPVCRFSGALGPKLKEGDRQAPEGFYAVGPEQMNPNSSYHLSFNLGFPNAYDRHHGRTGSFLMVHGGCLSVGCYAMGDDAVEEIWTLSRRALAGGQEAFAVHCFPFPLTTEKLAKYAEHTWIEFWRELKPIYAAFEERRIPPVIGLREGRYIIEATGD